MSSAAQAERRDGGQMAGEGAKVKEKRGFRERYYVTPIQGMLPASLLCGYRSGEGDQGVKVFYAVIFEEGDDLAVRLPDEIAFPVDTDVTIERHGDVLTVRPMPIAAEEGADPSSSL